MEEGQTARWDLFHSALDKGMTDSFLYDMGTVSSNWGSARKANEIKEGFATTRGWLIISKVMSVHIFKW